MNKTKVKICGIRSLEAAKVAIENGADYLGFNFVTTSKRYIDPNDAKKIIEMLPQDIQTVGVFQDAESDLVNDVAYDLNLNLVQLHGSEDEGYINEIEIEVIKSMTLLDNPLTIQTQYLLLDRVNREGEMVNLEAAANLASQFPIFFAGGLTPENVEEVVKKVKPYAVDVAGGIETDGVQDLEKIRLFIRNAKEDYGSK